MAELTNLETKLGEVLGLAMAAKSATEKFTSLVEDDELRSTLERMHDEAAETEDRCTEVASGIDGKKTAILEQARTTKAEAEEMMSTYLGDDADGLDAFEFLTMAEAGEVGHWQVVDTMSRSAGARPITELAEWALPIQRRHLEQAMDGSVALARQEDPLEVA